MSFSRRDVLLAGLGLVATGCATTSRQSANRSQPLWPDRVPTSGATPGHSSYEAYRPIHRPSGEPLPAATASPAAAPTTVAGVVPRAYWTKEGLSGRNVNPMKGVSKITIHHEGWTPVTFTSAAAAYDRIEKIRQIHTRDRGWADIGYHYIIDRAGRVIEGRNIAFQGAHVSENNPHNLGILVLGNFQQQQPSSAQVEALGRFAGQMMQLHRVPKSRVFTHREINPTECPGRYLQAQIDSLRHRGAIG